MQESSHHRCWQGVTFEASGSAAQPARQIQPPGRRSDELCAQGLVLDKQQLSRSHMSCFGASQTQTFLQNQLQAGGAGYRALWTCMIN